MKGGGYRLGMQIIPDGGVDKRGIKPPQFALSASVIFYLGAGRLIFSNRHRHCFAGAFLMSEAPFVLGAG